MNGLKYILPELPMSATISPNFGLDRNLLLFAFTISTLTGVVFGLVPALQAARTDLIPALKDDGSGSSRYRNSLLRNSLVVGQVAISLVLLIASGLFVRSLVQAGSIDPGFEHERTLAFKLDLARQQYDEDSGPPANTDHPPSMITQTLHHRTSHDLPVFMGPSSVARQ